MIRCRSGCGFSRSVQSKGNQRSGCCSRSHIESFKVLQHLVDKVRVVVLSVPRPNKLKQKQRLRERSLLFWRTLCAKGQKLDLGEEEVMQEIEKDFFFFWLTKLLPSLFTTCRMVPSSNPSQICVS